MTDGSQLQPQDATVRAPLALTTLDAIAAWQPSPRHFTRVIVGCVLLSALCFAPTLTISPTVWMDEVHIVEYGRLFLEPGTGWSIHWHGDHPVMPWYVFGGALADLASRVTAPSCLGTRLLGTAGALFSATMLALWLRQRTQPSAACLLALVYLFEPAFVAAYRGARLDGWAQGFAFTACYLLGAHRQHGGNWRLWAVGAVVAGGFFVWPSIAFLLPLMLLELVPLLRGEPQLRLGRILRIAIAGVCVGVSLGTLVWLRVPRVFSDVMRQLAIAGMTPQAPGDNFLTKLTQLLSLLFLRSPWHLALLAYAARTARSYLPLLWMSIPGALILSSMVYTNRTMYLVPYLIAFYAGAFVPGEASALLGVRKRRLGVLLLTAAFASSALVSVGLRSVNAWLQRSERAESNLVQAARAVPPFRGAICIQPLELYFVGRALGWRMFDGQPENIERCDAAVMGPASEAIAPQFQAAGFRREVQLLPPGRTDQTLYGARGFGPYWFYRRVPGASP